MKTIKHFIIITCLCVGAINATVAQSILSDEQQEIVTENVNYIVDGLNLSERDIPVFRDIMRDFFVGLVALRSTNFSMDTNKKVIKALVKGRDSRVKGLLSTDQHKVYKAQVKENQAAIKKFMKQQK